MGDDDGGLQKLMPAAVAVVSLAVLTIMGIAILGGFKATFLIDNSTADQFIAGLGIFGLFVGVLVLAIVGKIIMAMFKGGKGGGL